MPFGIIAFAQAPTMYLLCPVILTRGFMDLGCVNLNFSREMSIHTEVKYNSYIPLHLEICTCRPNSPLYWFCYRK